MMNKKVIIWVLVTACAVFSQQIMISGKITDSSGLNPLSGVAVKLEKLGYITTTENDGIFVFKGLATGISSFNNQFPLNTLFADIRNGNLSLHVLERSVVTITTYTIQGKAVSKIQKLFDRGVHRITQPRLGSGVYIYRIQTGSRDVVLKSSFSEQQGLVFASNESVLETVHNSMFYRQIEDMIIASKEGLLDHRVKVTNFDTSGIVIKMLPNAGTVTDADGNVYQSVKIGNQVWTVENWRSTKYNDGTAIPSVLDNEEWIALTGPGYCFYNNATHTQARKKWGALYNWFVIAPTNPHTLAPVGWRVPTIADWDTLQTYLIANGYNWDGTKTANRIAKSMAAKTDWSDCVNGGTIGCNLFNNNACGFSALPAGYRGHAGFFFNQSLQGLWWIPIENTSSTAFCRTLNYDQSLLDSSSYCKYVGLPVRLLRE